MKIYFSFVVDKTPTLYYQAELLLYSLQKNAHISRSDIIVQCVHGVSEKFLDFLQNRGYTYNLIEPFLDKKYCNKLRQLEYFKDLDCSGVVLLDTDMFVLNEINFSSLNIFQAKIVDAPNPSLSTLEKIYEKASLELPLKVRTDWFKDKETLMNNFNGGFYYIPRKYLKQIEKSWKYWATWLTNHGELFATPQERNHIDQISMGMALVEEKINYQHLSANYNFPLHNNVEPDSYDVRDKLRVVHYHWLLNDYGLLETSIEKPFFKEIVKNINVDIANDFNPHFFAQFVKAKKFHPQKKVSSKKLIIFDNKLNKLIKNTSIKLILHAGTPKTATTSLQFFFDENRELLLKKGILYPNLYLNTPAPKHQWIVGLLHEGNLDKLYDYIEKIYKEATKLKVDAILLSTEGIYNHWWDYSDEMKQALYILASFFNIQIWTVFREPLSFLDSIYKQYLKNPQMRSIPCYGQDWSFEEMYEDQWFLGHLNYLGFLLECENIFDESNVKALPYSREIIPLFQKQLGLEIQTKKYNKNPAQSQAVVSLLRKLNQYELSIEDKQKSVQILYELDTILAKYTEKKNFALAKEKDINILFALQKKELKNLYKLSFI